MRTLLIVSVLALSGCGITNIPPGNTSSQPRALQAGNFMPSCWIGCSITNSITSTEQGNEGAVTGGAATSQQTTTVSPSLNLSPSHPLGGSGGTTSAGPTGREADR